MSNNKHDEPIIERKDELAKLVAAKKAAQVGRKFNPKSTIEVPVWILPDSLQELHERLQNTREQVRELESEFRSQLREFFNSKNPSIKYPTV